MKFFSCLFPLKEKEVAQIEGCQNHADINIVALLRPGPLQLDRHHRGVGKIDRATKLDSTPTIVPQFVVTKVRWKICRKLFYGLEDNSKCMIDRAAKLNSTPTIVVTKVRWKIGRQFFYGLRQ